MKDSIGYLDVELRKLAKNEPTKVPKEVLLTMAADVLLTIRRRTERAKARRSRQQRPRNNPPAKRKPDVDIIEHLYRLKDPREI